MTKPSSLSAAPCTSSCKAFGGAGNRVASKSIVVAGATGSVGREIVRIAREHGYRATALARSASRMAGCADRVMPFDATEGLPELAGHDAVVSALGASVALRHPGRRGFRAVDFAGNHNLLLVAQRAGIGRYIYVAAHVEPGYADTAYIRAHEEFIAALAASSLSHAILRPTGIFTAFHGFLSMARRGLAIILGDGSPAGNHPRIPRAPVPLSEQFFGKTPRRYSAPWAAPTSSPASRSLNSPSPPSASGPACCRCPLASYSLAATSSAS